MDKVVGNDCIETVLNDPHDMYAELTESNWTIGKAQ